jgi:hypothetical protein
MLLVLGKVDLLIHATTIPIVAYFAFYHGSINVPIFAIAKASQVHTINVGYGGNFVFEPLTTYANVGDLIVFNFFPTNHSVVCGEYTGPEACG